MDLRSSEGKITKALYKELVEKIRPKVDIHQLPKSTIQWGASKIKYIKPKEFKKYIESLPQRAKESMFLYNNFDDFYEPAIKDKTLNSFLINEYEKLEKNSLKRDSFKMKRLELIVKSRNDNYLNLLFFYLNTLPVNKSCSRCGFFLNTLIEIGFEENAYLYFKQIIEQKVSFYKYNKSKIQHFDLLYDKSLLVNLINLKDKKIQTDFIDFSLKLVNQTSSRPNKFLLLISILWNSKILKKTQKKILLETLKKDQYKNVYKKYLFNYLGVSYIRNLPISYIKNELTIDEIYYVCQNELTIDEKKYILRFLESHKLSLSKNSEYYSNMNKALLYRLKSRINKKELDSKLSEFGIQSNIKKEDIERAYLSFSTGYKSTAIERPYRSYFLIEYYASALFDLVNFDFKNGTIPIEYDQIITEFGKKMKKRFNIDILVNQEVPNYDPYSDEENDLVYNIYIGHRGKAGYEIEIIEYTSWVKIDPVIKVLNDILTDSKLEERWFYIDINNGSFILTTPKIFEMFKKYIS